MRAHRARLRAAWVLAIASLLLPVGSKAAQPARPHVLLILVDDLGLSLIHI